MKVYSKAHSKHFTAKADPSFNHGFWIGRGPDSGEHLMIRNAGVFKARTIKGMQPSQRLPADLLGMSSALELEGR